VSAAIEDAKHLLDELKADTPRSELAAAAILLKPKSAAIIERLLIFIEGYSAGVMADQARITATGSALLSEIAKLRAARRGGRSLADDFIEGTAPRLFLLAERLRELLEA
jgi:hypothetical protein